MLIVHDPFTLPLSSMAVAATAPRESVLPCTTAHSPTFAAALVVALVAVYFVAAVTEITALPVVGDASALRRSVVTLIVHPDTAVTLPATPPKPPGAPRNPEGAPLGLRVGMFDGGAPVRSAREIPFPRQLPLRAGVMRMFVAVTAVELPELDADVANTQLPTLTAASVAALVIVNRVAVAYVTAV